MTVFSQITAFLLATELIAPQIGAALMTINPWIPFLVSTAIAAISVIRGVLLFPTINVQTESHPALPQEQQPARGRYPSERIRGFYQQLSQNKNVAFIVVSFFVTLLGTSAFAVLLQYMAKRFHVTYVEVRSSNALQTFGRLGNAKH